MMQKLFIVSSPYQRKNIMIQLSINIPNIVRNKQGTHTIQSFTTLFI